MSFGDYLKKGWEVVQLKGDAIDLLAQDEEAMGPALGILAIGGVAAAIGALSLPGIILMPILRLIGAFIFVGIMHFCATSFFGGTGGFKGVFIPISCASLITWIGIIPIVGPVLAVLAGIWLLVVSVVVVERVHAVDRGKAIVVVAIPLLIGLIIAAIFAVIAGATALMLMGATS
jgi:hypothetical protein